MTPSIDPMDLWGNPDIGFSEAQQALTPRLRNWMRTQDAAFARQLADLKVEDLPLPCKPKEMEGLQNGIETEFKSGKAAYAALVVLGKFVAYLNRIGKGPIPQPRISHLVAKPPNPFRQGIAQALACVRTWLAVERKWIEECAEAPPVELVIFSAILHGGLLHASSVISLTRALLEPSNLAYGCIGNRIYVNLSLPWRGEPEMEDRRWYPDDQTASLIRRPGQYAQIADWQNLDSFANDQIVRMLFRRIRQRMRPHRVQKEFRPASLKQLLDTAATAARTEVPAVLIEYASRRIVSHSLKLDVLQRIFGIAVTSDATKPEPLADEAATFASDLLPVDENPEDMEPEWLKQLRTAFRTEDSRTAGANLEALLSAFPDPSCPGHRITDFARYLLTERHRDLGRFVLRKPLELSTVKAWSLTVARRFGRILGEQDPVALTTENLETLYTQTLENIVEGDDPRQLRSKVAHVLREFQRFMVGKLGAAPIEDRAILGSPRGLLPVDAKIITLEQYSAARRYLREQSHREYDAKFCHAAEAMLIFGFRCGTRRMEAYGLDLPDLTDRQYPWLLVRPTQGRQLKTDNAKRQLPLWCLMPEDELDVLYSCKQERIQDGGSKECSQLFAAPAEDENGVVATSPLPVQKLMALLHDALRQATGDRTFHFHHLRHSFATWTFLRLMLSDLEEIPDLFPHLPETTAWFQNAKTFRRQLYGTAYPTRRHAMAVASLLGHSGPSVSMEHYIHCMDWLLPLFLSQSTLLQIPSTRKVILASARPKSALYESEQKLGDGSIAGKLFQQRFPELTATPDIGQATAVCAEVIGSGSVSWVRNTWDLLFFHATTKEPLDTLADRLGFDLEAAELVLDRAKKIQQIAEPKGRKSARHSMETAAMNRRRPSEKIAIACPQRCKNADGRKVIETLESKLSTMLRNDGETIRRVLAYYVNNAWKTSNILPFRNPEQPDDAIRYRKFLNDLGIPDSRMRFIFFDQRERSKSRGAWKNALNLSWRHRERIELCDPPYRESSASDRWLGIEPDFRGKGPGKTRGGPDGFRFLMVMAAVRFGYTTG